MKLLVLLAAVVVTCATHNPDINHKRIKRQDATDLVIDSIFQVPIQILTVTNSLVKNTRPLIMQVRDRIMQTYGSSNQGNRVGGPGSFFQQSSSQKRLQDQINAQRTQAAKTGGYRASRDGSFFRI